MIKLTRPAKVPKILSTKGVTTTLNDCKEYESDSSEFIKNFTADSSVYGNKTVKRTLKKAQHNKCCFCEKDQEDEYGAVEHFRPKGGYKINKEQKKLTTPGYYWLAYTWSNLLFVCGPCNTSHKKNYFPLVDETRRASSHLSSVEEEEAYLIDPYGTKDPRDHIYFDFNLPAHKDIFGQKTIEICGLDRDSLNTARAKHISDISARLTILDEKDSHSLEEVAKARQFIKDSIKPEAKFSSTAISYLKNFNIVFKNP